MSAWHSQNRTRACSQHFFLDDYNYELLLRRLSGSDLFRASAALQIHATFDAKLFQNSVVRRPVPYFVDGYIQAVRLDSLDGVLSCYLFTGTAQAILDLKSSMDAVKWRTLGSAFSIKPVYLRDLGLGFYSDDVLFCQRYRGAPGRVERRPYASRRVTFRGSPQARVSPGRRSVRGPMPWINRAPIAF